MQKNKKNLNISVHGLHQGGKSTICGHLLLQLGIFSEDDFGVLEGDADDLGHGGYEYAWITNTSKTERELDLTLYTHLCYITQKDCKLCLFDTPGYNKYLKDTVKYAAISDVHMIVVDPTVLNTSLDTCKDLQEYLKWNLIYEPHSTIVVVNKMDCKEISWDEKKFHQIKEKIIQFANLYGLDYTKVPFVPVSGYLGDNLIQKGKHLNWYNGPTLFEALKQIPKIDRPLEDPLMICVLRKYPVSSEDVVCDAIVLRGTLKKGVRVCVLPSRLISLVKSLQIQQQDVEYAGAGDVIGMVISDSVKYYLERGSIIVDLSEENLKVCKQFVANICILDLNRPLKPSNCPCVYFPFSRIVCQITQMVSKFNKKTGEILQDNPPFLVPGDNCKVVFTPKSELTALPFEESKFLGKFIIRHEGKTYGYGTITEVQDLN
ncbi:elongation factor 1-alpha 2 [Anaeramoeba flamelloides]|uniref:Elongation factor 1-alpha 2 n=1 Tax=Anaeramoeba flamelloides TaxID=1746091 RepID=A0ABQ8XQ06_9EUKA|nr:elongation factor 1-alpha 2 [Anaeramoeba flamelloides]